MIRRIIEINKEKCNGCGKCASACHEGAIAIINGKAQLIRDDYCDGLGDCLPQCPTGAISFVEREAAAYDEAAVKARMQASSGCPGSRSRSISQSNSEKEAALAPSRLSQWPVQIKLAPLNAPYFNGASILVAADCSAYACGSFHESFIKGRVTLIGCPKLDGVDYSEKLCNIFTLNDIRDITVVRMEVPCCGGLENAVKKAVLQSGKDIPVNIVTLTLNGAVL